MDTSLRNKSPLSCIAFDVDCFKLINDGLGHAAGDKVLAYIGQLLASRLRPTDLAGRIGGEEFTILLPNTDLASAIEIAERFRIAFACHNHSNCPAFTASFGVAEIEPQDREFSEILGRADEAMYLAKSKGRNQTCSKYQGCFRPAIAAREMPTRQ